MISITTEYYSTRLDGRGTGSQSCRPILATRWDGTLTIGFDTAPRNDRSRYARVALSKEELLARAIEAHGGVPGLLNAISDHLQETEKCE